MIKGLFRKVFAASSADPPPEATLVTMGHSTNDGSQLDNTEGNLSMAINLKALTEIDGFIGACMVDSESGMVLGMIGGNGSLDLEIAAAGNTQVVSAKRKTMKALGLTDKIEDILISLRTQYHVIRPLESNDAIFIYVALDRARSNLGMARMQIKSFEKEVDISV